MDANAVDSKAYLTGLPTELLQECFHYAVDAELAQSPPRIVDSYPCTRECRAFPRHRTAWALSLTCKYFHRVVQPMLYSDVDVVRRNHCVVKLDGETCAEIRQWRAIWFCESVERYPDLGRLCEVLALNVDTFAQLAGMKDDESTLFGKLRKLKLAECDADGGNWTSCVWAVRRLPALEELTLKDTGRGGLAFGYLSLVLPDLKSLKRLSLDGIASPEAPRAWNGWPMVDAATLRRRLACEEEASPPATMMGSAPFTALHLKGFTRGSPEALKNFLQWPAALETFTLGIVGMGGYRLADLVAMGQMTYPWTFRHLRDALHQHRTTLRELRVRHMATQEGLDVFDLRDFPALRTFQICNIGVPEPEEACRFWLTPSLQRLVLDSAYNESQQGVRWYFDPEHLGWLEEFTARAASRRHSGVAVGLQTIEVLYANNTDSDYCYEDQVDNHPVRLLPRAKAHVEAMGFGFVCPEDIAPPELLRRRRGA